VERARLLFGLYRKGDANDPETYVAGVTAVLAEYAPEVVRRVTDPRTGLARTVSWLPTLKEVSDACDAAKTMIECEPIMAAKGYRWNGKQWVKGAA
jgi:hypothetical protein